MKVGDLVMWTGTQDHADSAIGMVDIGIVIGVDRFQPNWVTIRWFRSQGAAMYPMKLKCLEVISEVLR
jgi:hypothetical protein